MLNANAYVFRCDFCGAGLSADAPKCRYCGQTSVIFVRGERLTTLLELFVQTLQWEELREVASDVLKEHPFNAVAWAAKGIVSVAIEDNGEAAQRCFELAQRTASKDSLVSEFRHEAAEICFKKAQNGWLECLNNNAVHYDGLWDQWITSWLQSQLSVVMVWATQSALLDPQMQTQANILLGNANNAWAAHTGNLPASPPSGFMARMLRTIIDIFVTFTILPLFVNVF